jgi:hypothetical protein
MIEKTENPESSKTSGVFADAFVAQKNKAENP